MVIIFAKDGKFDKMLNDAIIEKIKSYKSPIDITESYRSKCGNNIIPLIGNSVGVRVEDEESENFKQIFIRSIKENVLSYFCYNVTMMDVYDFNIFYFYFLRYNCAGEGMQYNTPTLLGDLEVPRTKSKT